MVFEPEAFEQGVGSTQRRGTRTTGSPCRQCNVLARGQVIEEVLGLKHEPGPVEARARPRSR